MEKSYALITGGGRGIGLEFANSLAEDGHNLLLVGRNEETLRNARESLLQSFPKIVVKIMSLDLTTPNATQQVMSFIQSERIEVDILVNNAGASKPKAFLSLTQGEITQETLLDLQAPLLLMHAFISKWREMKKGGTIINVNSLVVFSKVHPTLPLYRILKRAFSEGSKGMREELKQEGVQNISVHDVYFGAITGTEIETSDVANKSPGKMSAKEAVKITLSEVKKGKTTIIPGILNKLGMIFGRFVPAFIQENQLRKLYSK